MSIENFRKNRLVWLAVIFALIFHHDFWWWHDATLILGLPVGLLYHFGYCLLASVFMFALVKLTWPSHSQADKRQAAGS